MCDASKVKMVVTGNSDQTVVIVGLKGKNDEEEKTSTGTDAESDDAGDHDPVV